MPLADVSKMLKEVWGEPLHKLFRKTYRDFNKLFTRAIFKDIKKLGKAVGKEGPFHEFLYWMDALESSLQHSADGLLNFFIAIGVFQPIISTINALISLFAAEMISNLMPAMSDLIDVMVSPEFISFLKNLAKVFSVLLYPVIQGIAGFLKLLTGQTMTPIEVGGAIGTVVGAIVGAALASFIGMPWLGGIIGGFIGSIIGKGIGHAVQGWGATLAQEGGIFTRPTRAIIGEAGTEAVIPLDRAGEFGLGESKETIVINIEGGVFAKDVDDLARQIARKIELYRFGKSGY